MTDDAATLLLARIRARLDADERIALAASVGNFGGQTPTGEHWHWVCNECDTEAPIDPVTVLDEHLTCPACGNYGLGLRSVERYPSGLQDIVDRHTLPHMVVDTEELRPADGLHITRHDPARVLATVAALREVLDIIERDDSDLANSRVGHAMLSALDRIGGDHG